MRSLSLPLLLGSLAITVPTLASPLDCAAPELYTPLAEDPYPTDVTYRANDAPFPLTPRPYNAATFRAQTPLTRGGEFDVFKGTGHSRSVVIKQSAVKTKEGAVPIPAVHYEAPAEIRRGEHPGKHFIAEPLAHSPDRYVEEYVGPNLRQQFAVIRAGGFPAQQKLALEIAEGLSAAHAAGIVHNDIKPDNILLTEKGNEARLSDWGNATRRNGSTDGVGTPKYANPWPGKSIQPRQDIYSAGMTLAETLYGKVFSTSEGNILSDCCVKYAGMPFPHALPREAIFSVLKKQNAQTDPDLEMLSTLALLATQRSSPFNEGKEWAQALKQAGEYRGKVADFYRDVVNPHLAHMTPADIAQLIAADPRGMQERWAHQQLGLDSDTQSRVVQALEALWKAEPPPPTQPLADGAPNPYIDRVALRITLDSLHPH